MKQILFLMLLLAPAIAMAQDNENGSDELDLIAKALATPASRAVREQARQETVEPAQGQPAPRDTDLLAGLSEDGESDGGFRRDQDALAARLRKLQEWADRQRRTETVPETSPAPPAATGPAPENQPQDEFSQQEGNPVVRKLRDRVKELERRIEELQKQLAEPAAPQRHPEK